MPQWSSGETSESLFVTGHIFGQVNLGDLMGAAPPGRGPGLGLFGGTLYRSRVHMYHVRKGKELAKLRRNSAGTKRMYGKLKLAWDNQVLRAGDHAIGFDDDGDDTHAQKLHPNMIGPRAILRVSWQGVGKGWAQPAGGVSGASSVLAFSCAAASACSIIQGQAIASTVASILANRHAGGLVVSRHYDASPWHIRFGCLQDLLFPHARYLIKEKGADGQMKWKLVPMSTYQALHPRARMASGVMEIFAETTFMAFTSDLDTDKPTQHHHACLMPPVVLQAASASVIHWALETSIPASVSTCPTVASALSTTSRTT